MSDLKGRGEIDDVVWNGRLNEFGLAYPAPGGKEGLPDIYFFIGKTLFLLEVTTIRGGDMQWKAEVASVNDHIINQLRKANGKYDVVGLFSAPIISPRALEMFKHISSKDKIQHNPISIDDFIKILENGKEEIKKLIRK